MKSPEFPNLRKRRQPPDLDQNFRNELFENCRSIWLSISGNFGRMVRALHFYSRSKLSSRATRCIVVSTKLTAMPCTFDLSATTMLCILQERWTKGPICIFLCRLELLPCSVASGSLAAAAIMSIINFSKKIKQVVAWTSKISEKCLRTKPLIVQSSPNKLEPPREIEKHSSYRELKTNDRKKGKTVFTVYLHS